MARRYANTRASLYLQEPLVVLIAGCGMDPNRNPINPIVSPLKTQTGAVIALLSGPEKGSARVPGPDDTIHLESSAKKSVS